MRESRSERPDENGIPTDLAVLAELLDSKYLGPFGFRYGWDGIIGLIPGIGDIATTICSCYIIARAALLGVSVSILLRMGLNVLIDNAISIVPVAGWIGDFVWKSNLMNLELIRRRAKDPAGTSRRSAGVIGFALISMLGFLMGTAFLGGYAIWKVFVFMLGWFG